MNYRTVSNIGNASPYLQMRRPAAVGVTEADHYERARSALRFIPVGGHDQRVRVAFMLQSAFGEAGRQLFDEWRDGRGDDEANSVWRSASKPGPLTIASLFHEAKAHGWRDDLQYRRPSQAETAERRRIAAALAAKEQAAIARERAATAERAAAILKVATEAKADHPYLVRKRVSPTVTLREIDAGAAAAILGYAPKSGGDLLTGRLLAVPVKQGGSLSTVELISPSGLKAALAGRGTKTGGFWATEKLPDDDGAGQTVLVGEGVVTVLSGSEATGYPGIAALSSGNLTAAAKAMREDYPAAKLVILADLVKATGEPDPHAIEAAKIVAGMVAIPDFGSDRDPGMKDVNDLHALSGLGSVRDCIFAAQLPDEEVIPEAVIPASLPVQAADAAPKEMTETERIAWLASLSPLDYDRVREAEAKKLGVRTGTLDKLVRQARNENEKTDGIDFDEVEPWPDPIDPAILLDDLSATIKRFIICQDETAHAAALWCAMTWFMDVVHVAPIAVITAPEKRCGKSQLLFLIGRLVPRPLAASNITPAALFRAVDAWKPTLLIDEADAFMRDNEELRGLLNCGHTRDSAYIVRVVGDDHTPMRFFVWGAKALAGIGHLADTIMDRAIVLELRRKLPHEEVERLRYAEPGLFDELASRMARFAIDYREVLRKSRPELPAALNDRAQDNWEPPIAIADVAGGHWPERARRAALKLSGSNSDGGTVGNELLADIKEIFETRLVQRITTANLIEALCEDEEKSWATYNRGRQISPRQVASRLKEYGISSKNIRTDTYGVSKGFELKQFEEAFSRYLSSPEKNPLQSYSMPKACIHEASGVAEPALRDSLQGRSATNFAVFCDPEGIEEVAHETLRSATENLSAAPQPAETLACSGVADKGQKTAKNSKGDDGWLSGNAEIVI